MIYQFGSMPIFYSRLAAIQHFSPHPAPMGVDFPSEKAEHCTVNRQPFGKIPPHHCLHTATACSYLSHLCYIIHIQYIKQQKSSYKEIHSRKGMDCYKALTLETASVNIKYRKRHDITDYFDTCAWRRTVLAS